MRLLAINPAVADHAICQLEVLEGVNELGGVVEAKRGRARHCSVLGVGERHFPKGVKLRPFPFVKIRPKWGFDYPPTKGSFGKKGLGGASFSSKVRTSVYLSP